MDEETPEGAEQAYRYYWAVMVWAHQTGDTGEIGNLSADSCDACVRYIDTVQELLEADGLWKGPVQTDVDVASISDSAELSDEGYDVAVIYELVLSEHSVLDEESGDRVPEPETTYRTTGGLVWDGERWVVDGCAIQPLEEVTG